MLTVNITIDAALTFDKLLPNAFIFVMLLFQGKVYIALKQITSSIC